MNSTSDTSRSLGYRDFQNALIRTASDLSRLSAASATADIASLVTSAEQRLDHLAEGDFVVAMIGAFKRGKSTLTNALLGAAIMPADITPATATLNRVIYGREPRATLRLKDGSSRAVAVAALSEHVTKLSEAAAERAAAIQEAVIEFPTYLCANNVQLLDTPGLGDEAAMTTLTESVMSKIDAAIFVTNATSALSQSELTELSQLLQHVDRSCIAIAVTHFDLVEDVEDRERVLAGVRKRAAPLLGEDPPTFGVDARAGLRAKQVRDDGALRTSGLTALEEWLESFLVRESGIARLRAANETVHSLASDLHAQIAEKLGLSEGVDQAQNARLAALKAEFDDVQAGLEAWINDLGAWAPQNEQAEMTQLADDMPGSLAKLAKSWLPSLTASDVTDPDARHRRLRERINSKLYAAFDSKLDRLSSMLTRQAAAHRRALAALATRWAAVRVAELEAEESPSRSLVTLGPAEVFGDGALDAHEAVFSEAKERFAASYGNRCDYVSISGALDRWFSSVTPDTVRKVQGDTESHVAAIAESACQFADPTRTGGRYVAACVATLLPFAEQLASEIGGSIDRLKWDLELRAAKLETTRAVAIERLRLCQVTVQDVQAQAEARRGVLQRLAIVSTHETENAEPQPEMA